MGKWTQKTPNKAGWYVIFHRGIAEFDNQGGYQIYHLHPATTTRGYHEHGCNFTLELGALCWGACEKEDVFPRDFFSTDWNLFKSLEPPLA